MRYLPLAALAAMIVMPAQAQEEDDTGGESETDDVTLLS
jgi:hypothetical protein